MLEPLKQKKKTEKKSRKDKTKRRGRYRNWRNIHYNKQESTKKAFVVKEEEEEYEADKTFNVFFVSAFLIFQYIYSSLWILFSFIIFFCCFSLKRLLACLRVCVSVVHSSCSGVSRQNVRSWIIPVSNTIPHKILFHLFSFQFSFHHLF